MTRDTAALALGYLPYVVACVRANRPEPTPPRVEYQIRSGSIAHSLRTSRMTIGVLAEHRAHMFLLDEVQAGRIGVDDCHRIAQAFLGPEDALSAVIQRLTSLMGGRDSQVQFV